MSWIHHCWKVNLCWLLPLDQLYINLNCIICLWFCTWICREKPRGDTSYWIIRSAWLAPLLHWRHHTFNITAIFSSLHLLHRHCNSLVCWTQKERRKQRRPLPRSSSLRCWQATNYAGQSFNITNACILLVTAVRIYMITFYIVYFLGPHWL